MEVASATRRRFLFGTVLVGVGSRVLAGSTAGQSYLSDWLSDAINYQWVVDLRGNDSVTIEVGTGKDGLYGLKPAAAHISPGTTVRFEWVTDGHRIEFHAASGDVIPPDERTTKVGDRGFTYEYTFSGDGWVTYSCGVHEALGARGALLVGETDVDLKRESESERTSTGRPSPAEQGQSKDDRPSDSGSTSTERRHRGFLSNSRTSPSFLDILNLTVVGFVLSVVGLIHQLVRGR